MKVIDYQIVRGSIPFFGPTKESEPYTLEAKVKRAVAAGWQPHGPTFKISSQERGQAMVLHEEENP